MSLETGTYISDLVETNPTASDPKSQGDDHLRLIKACVKATFPNITGAVTPTHTELNFVDGVTSAIQTQLDAKAALASPALTGTPTAPTASAGANSTQVATTAYVDAADALKANLASPTFTGTPAAPTAAAGTNTTQVATTAFVQQQAFSTALPVQSGNAGKILSTDGSSASWTVIPSAPDVIMRASTGQALTAGTWTDCVVNTTDRNANSLAALASNQITLPAGTYYARASAAYSVSYLGSTTTTAQLRLFNATDSAAVGSAGMAYAINADSTSSVFGTGVAEVALVFTLAATKAIKLQAFASNSAQATETASFVEVWKVA